MRIVTFNILEGFRTRPERKAAAVAWLQETQPDVLALQEMNGYTSESLAADARKWNHPYSELLKLEGYSPALTSRYPLILGARGLEGFKHGLLHVTAAEIDFFVVHLSPFNHVERWREAELILGRVHAARGTGRSAIVLGDFNALSPDDADYYATHSDVREFTRSTDAKFGWSNAHDGQLDFTVLQKFLDAGLFDVVTQKNSDPRARISYSTPLLEGDRNTEAHARRSMRLDFILASPDLAARCRQAQVVRNPTTALLSDHYPVVADFAM